MISIKRALKSNRLMRATTGLSVPKFNKLAKSFDQELKKDTLIRLGVTQFNKM
jgi:hypothetical protein